MSVAAYVVSSADVAIKLMFSPAST